MSSVDLTWLLDDVTRRVPEIEKIVMLSRDGLVLGSSSTLAREDAERLGAIVAGFQGLAQGAAEHLARGQVRQVVVEMSGKFLLVTLAGAHGCLVAVTSDGADVGTVGYEMARLAARVRTYVPGPVRALPGDTGA